MYAFLERQKKMKVEDRLYADYIGYLECDCYKIDIEINDCLWIECILCKCEEGIDMATQRAIKIIEKCKQS